MNAHTPQQRAVLKAKFFELWAAGVSRSSIAEQLHITEDTCAIWEQEVKIQTEEPGKHDGYGFFPFYMEDRSEVLLLHIQPHLYELIKLKAFAIDITVEDYIHSVLEAAVKREET